LMSSMPVFPSCCNRRPAYLRSFRLKQPCTDNEDTPMPYVNIKITKEGATAAQKAELISGVTALLQKVQRRNRAVAKSTEQEPCYYDGRDR
jgi:hypothetical protein